MKNRLLPVVVVFVLALAGCGRSVAPTPLILSSPSPAPPREVPPPDLTARTYPSVDGSTSTLPLQMLIACRLLDVPCDWHESFFLEAVRSIGPGLNFEGAPEEWERLNQIRHSGTHGSYVKLIEGEADFVLVARLPSEDELKAARDKGVVLDAVAVALDAFVFLVHADNGVEALDLETLRAIYMGDITRWADATAQAGQGAEVDSEIHPYQRNRNSGSQELMEKLVMQGTPMMDAPNMLLESMIGPINAIGGDPLGIGYSVYFYATFINPGENIKLIGVDGVLPTSETIADRSYPLMTEVYAVIREGMPQESSVVQLRDWVLARGGQAVVEESGYVPVR